MVDGFMQNSSTSRPARNSAEVRFSKYSEYSFQAQYAAQRDRGKYICLDSLPCKTRKKDGQKHNNNVMAISRAVMYIPATVLVKDPEGLPDVPLDVRVPELPKKSDLLSTAQITIIYQNKDVCACWYALIMEACVYQSR